jgi:branched-chain amino acid transport system ATP-binding protein
MKKILKVEKLSAYYGKIHAIRDVSIKLNEGETVSIIGANGAGKSTLLRCVMGLHKNYTGLIQLFDTDVKNVSTWNIVKQHIVMVPEGRQVFPEMTVKENLNMGAYLVKDKGEAAARIDGVYEWFPKLKIREQQLAGTLSGGEQQMLAMGRALMAKPIILLLDEPSMGLAPIIVDDIYAIINKITATGATILLVEQNALKALRASNRGYVLETGRIVMEDTADNLLNNSQVREAYLGI